MDSTTSSPQVERYVSAVLERVPESRRDEAARQVRADVAAAVALLSTAAGPPAEAERSALVQLGDPARLAERFGGRGGYLIGPDRYRDYVRLLRLLLVTVLPSVGAVMLILQGMTGTSVPDVLLGTAGIVLQVGLQLVLWTTVVFALLDRFGTDEAADWTPDDLPEQLDGRITAADTVLGVAVLSLLIWALLWQRDHWLVTAGDGTEVPVLNPDLWSSWWPVLIGVLVANIVLEVVKFAVGSWTVPLAGVNTALNAAFAGIVLWLWQSDLLLNPQVADILPDGVLSLVSSLPWVILVICALDAGQGWWRALRGRRG